MCVGGGEGGGGVLFNLVKTFNTENSLKIRKCGYYELFFTPKTILMFRVG